MWLVLAYLGRHLATLSIPGKQKATLRVDW
jgi:hypothetical protein